MSTNVTETHRHIVADIRLAKHLAWGKDLAGWVSSGESLWDWQKDLNDMAQALADAEERWYAECFTAARHTKTPRG